MNRFVAVSLCLIAVLFVSCNAQPSQVAPSPPEIQPEDIPENIPQAPGLTAGANAWKDWIEITFTTTNQSLGDCIFDLWENGRRDFNNTIVECYEILKADLQIWQQKLTATVARSCYGVTLSPPDEFAWFSFVMKTGPVRSAVCGLVDWWRKAPPETTNTVEL